MRGKKNKKQTNVESPNFDVLYVNAYTVCIMHFIIVYSWGGGEEKKYLKHMHPFSNTK